MAIWRSIGGALVTIWLVLTIVFLMIHGAPGGPFDNEKAMSATQRAQLQKIYGLDRPLSAQYLKFLSNLIHGDLGVSLVMEGESVGEIIVRTFPVSLGLGVGALIVAVGVGVPLGFYAALKERKHRWVVLLAMLPSFVLAPLVQQLVLVCGGVAYGYRGLSSLVLPSIILGLYYLPLVTRLTQSGFTEESHALYIRVVQAKGLPRLTAFLKHACRAALSPVLAYLGPTAAGLITGSFVVETVWGLPGMGRFFINAVFNRDDTLLLGLVAFYTVVLVGFNCVIELVLQYWNPSIERKTK